MDDDEVARFWALSDHGKLGVVGLTGGVKTPVARGRVVVFMQRSQTPEAFETDCLHNLQKSIGLTGGEAEVSPKLKSKLILAAVAIVTEGCLPWSLSTSDSEQDWSFGALRVLSRLLTFSTASLSYWSQIFAVFPCEKGAARGFLKVEAVGLRGDETIGAAEAIVQVCYQLNKEPTRTRVNSGCRGTRED